MAREKKDKVTVEHRKLGKHKADGMAYPDEKHIVIDSRQKGQEYLDTAIHELLHIYCPYLAEEEVAKVATGIADGLWGLKIRKVDE